MLLSAQKKSEKMQMRWVFIKWFVVAHKLCLFYSWMFEQAMCRIQSGDQIKSSHMAGTEYSRFLIGQCKSLIVWWPVVATPCGKTTTSRLKVHLQKDAKSLFVPQKSFTHDFSGLWSVFAAAVPKCWRRQGGGHPASEKMKVWCSERWRATGVTFTEWWWSSRHEG